MNWDFSTNYTIFLHVSDSPPDFYIYTYIQLFFLCISCLSWTRNLESLNWRKKSSFFLLFNKIRLSAGGRNFCSVQLFSWAQVILIIFNSARCALRRTLQKIKLSSDRCSHVIKATRWMSMRMFFSGCKHLPWDFFSLCFFIMIMFIGKYLVCTRRHGIRFTLEDSVGKRRIFLN